MSQVYGHYENEDNVYVITNENISAVPEEEQVRLMVDWFYERFEDPANRMPYDSREGGYQWIWGGPHDANEELQNEFSPTRPHRKVSP